MTDQSSPRQQGGEPMPGHISAAAQAARICVLCSKPGAHLDIVRICGAHVVGDVETALEDMRSALTRWLLARDAAPVMVDPDNHVTYRDSREYEAATDALEAVARRVVQG